MREGFAALLASILFGSTPALASSPVSSAASEVVAAEASEITNLRSLNIAVQGSVPQQCAIGNVGDVNFGDLNRTGLTATARVAFSCNVPFSMSVRGRSGALTHTLMPNGQGPYGGSVPYTIGVKMAVRHPTESIVSRAFNGSELRSGGVFSSEGGIATDGMMLSVALGSPSGEAGLLAGNYSETITITVMPT